ncbi:ras GTPase-activating protein 1-like isoform X2 [Amphibalanus amphitrite]|uniref:ras GTPase-activating protein 1-like isoform X1 n=1 Tax=Amphibalanus amphitrite TaxID=1232801 RepID=UPI001C927983|nr:ras GTPase-activating protein 1-like isoform X1 [Amphibalanus amphitrite]XP_043221541.1 ras GTPase-activating protein 1-like isoform X2 [Amphibalanus amphitrite]XP_043247703.1 ras GTPase-activating protein 1-like isoform X1 [Amphibalanus amphitrite]XP_043247704.1 ras GTPase-activating protein 1-like isoform X2 [Amphibalanus amphitrite]
MASARPGTGRHRSAGHHVTSVDIDPTEPVVDEFDPFQDQNNVDVDEDPTYEPPPEKEWYHGRLDRQGSEERLRNFGKTGAYLIRESDRKPGSYVLSFLGRTGVNHFRITAVYGDFYIGGRQFASLSDLIGYYTQYSDLLKRERLEHPVPPPEPVNDRRKAVAVLPYTKMPDTEELSFQKGDIFFVHNDCGDGWLWVTAHRSGEQGLIFQELTETLDETVDPNSVYPWFHGTVSKNEAVDLLVKAGPGSYLVRPSDNSPGDYSLFFHINNQIQRFRIEKRGVRYVMGGRTFECLEAVINRYKVEQIVEGHTLSQPVKKVSSELDGPVQSRVVHHADEIYATLRECREMQGLKKSKGIKMQGYLSKKNEKNKKWKTMYFVLQVEGTDTHLLFYDNPKRMKPKGLMDLSCAYVYPVDDSLFDRSFCFQIVEKALPCLATVTYLCAGCQDSMQDWVSALKPLCVPQNARLPKVANLRELRCLQITVLEAYRLPLKLVPSPFCVIAVNQVKVARTKVKTGPDPVWGEDFVLDDLPPDVLTFSAMIYNKGKRSKDSEVAEVTVELKDLTSGEETENWYQLSGITPIGEWGSLRLRLRYSHDLAMPCDEYSSLKELLLDGQLEVVRALAGLRHVDRLPLAAALLKVFRFEKKEAELLQTLNDLEIETEEDKSTLFRGATLTTALLDLYMKSVCTGFLHVAISDMVNKIVESKQTCELNPSKMDHQDDACSNAEYLLEVLDRITDSIFLSAEDCPRTLRYICGCLQRSVAAKWPNEKLVRTRVVSGFVFLRLICPAILNPRQFGLLTEPPPLQGARSLVMVAKCLQNLANLVEFGGKEPYMEVVNPFIIKNRERMVGFLDHLSNVQVRPEPEDLPLKGDPARELGIIHQICSQHLKHIQDQCRTQPSLRKLVTVTQILDKHKKTYQEMIRQAASGATTGSTMGSRPPAPSTPLV